MINSSIKNYKHSSRHENIFLCAIWEPQIGKTHPKFGISRKIRFFIKESHLEEKKKSVIASLQSINNQPVERKS